MHILIDILHADKEFVEKHSEGLSKLCFHHLNMFMEAKKDVTPQIEKIFKINKAAIEKNINDLEWFITKFDYRFHDEPWYDSRIRLKSIEIIERWLLWLGFLLKLLIVKSGSNVFKLRFEFSQKEKVERLVEQINKIARYYNIIVKNVNRIINGWHFIKKFMSNGWHIKINQV